MAKKRGGATVAEAPLMNVINKRFDPECPVSALKLHPDNPRQGDVGALHTSIDTNGFYGAVVAQESTGYVLAGNHRKIAAEQIGARTLPTIWVDCDDATAKRILTADNRLNDLADYDTNALAKLLEEIREDETGLGWMGTGWDDEAFANLLDDLNGIESEDASVGLTEDDDVPDAPTEATTVLGDLWILGKHRLLCGDSTSIDAVDRVINGDPIGFVFTDPPYGVGFRYGGHSDEGGAKYAEFMREIWHILQPLNCPVVLTPGNNNVPLWMTFGDFKMACWIKKNAMSPASIAHLNIFEILLLSGVKKKRNTDLFEYPTRQQSGVGDHPCPKLMELVVDVIDSWADPNTTLFEPFGGSGTTLIACEKTKRKARLMELDPKYCDVIVKRWQDYTGKIAKLESDGRTFNDIANLRKPKTGTAAAP